MKSGIILISITGMIFSVLTIHPVFLFSGTRSFEEFRAVCLHDYMFSAEEDTAASELRNILDLYATIGINNIFCFYDLSGKQRDYDFLKIMLEAAHRKGMKVHPIVHPGYTVKLEGEIKLHPEWLIRGRKGEIYPHLNLANPDARKYILRNISNILKYNIDGIHLDYIRFPTGQGFSYDNATCKMFKDKFGKSPLEVKNDAGSIIWCEWIKWNAEQVTALVREVKALIKDTGEYIPLSADVFPDLETAKVEIAQDWGRWAEEGLVDFICPMIYTNNLEVFRKYVKSAVKIADGKCLVYPTIGCSTSHNKNTPEGVVRSVRIARNEGADGIYFFSGYSLRDEFVSKLQSTVFKDK